MISPVITKNQQFEGNLNTKPRDKDQTRKLFSLCFSSFINHVNSESMTSLHYLSTPGMLLLENGKNGKLTIGKLHLRFLFRFNLYLRTDIGLYCLKSVVCWDKCDVWKNCIVLYSVSVYGIFLNSEQQSLTFFLCKMLQ